MVNEDSHGNKKYSTDGHFEIPHCDPGATDKITKMLRRTIISSLPFWMCNWLPHLCECDGNTGEHEYCLEPGESATGTFQIEDIEAGTHTITVKTGDDIETIEVQV